MKILSIPTLGVLSLTLAGCIGNDNHDIDPSICDHHPGEYNCPDASSESSMSDAMSSSSAPVVVTSSSAPVVVTSSSAPVVVTSSSAPVVVTSSSAPVVVASSSAPVVVTSSSAPVVVTSSSSPVVVSSSSAPMASSSAAAVNIEDLSFTEALTDDQSVEVDAVANLGEAFINLIDKDAFDAFYLDLVAQGLDEAAIKKAVAALTPVGTAIGAEFIKQLSGEYVIPLPEGINLIAPDPEEVGFGLHYSYSVNQTIDDVAVALNIELQFPNTPPGATIDNGEGGVKTFRVSLDGLTVVVNELTLTTSDVAIALDTTNPLINFGGALRVVAVTGSDGSIEMIEAKSAPLAVHLEGSVVNGIIGVDADAIGTIGGLDIQVDMAADTATVGVTQPDVVVNMQGVDTSN